MPLGRTTKALWEFSYRLFVNIWQKPTEKTLVGHQHRLDNALLKDTQVRLTKCLVLIINTVEHETGVNYIFLHAGVSLKHCFKSLWMQHVVHRSQRRWWRVMGGVVVGKTSDVRCRLSWLQPSRCWEGYSSLSEREERRTCQDRGRLAREERMCHILDIQSHFRQKTVMSINW